MTTFDEIKNALAIAKAELKLIYPSAVFHLRAQGMPGDWFDESFDLERSISPHKGILHMAVTLTADMPVSWFKQINPFEKEKTKLVYLAHFCMKEFPGCCGICISTGAQTYKPHRNKGIGTIMHQLRIGLAHAFGYTMLTCTIVDGCPTEKILNKFHWHKAFTFKNRRTANNVSAYYLPLR